MARQLDERFLTVHPRTALWWEQREQCRTCRHCSIVASGSGTESYVTSWHCRANGTKNVACLDARDEACGPDARLYEPKENTP